MRSIPAALQTSLDSGVTTLCYLLKIVPVTAPSFGVTSLDIDLTYDDGGGDVVYSSKRGLNQSSVMSSEGLEVANSESMILLDTELTRDEIESGALDYAEFFIYRVNWKDLSAGHYMLQSGTTGIVKSHDDLAAVIELRGISQLLKQNFVELYSISCRATFGTQVGDEMFPCLFDISTIWTSGTVTGVGADADKGFVPDALPAATGPNGALGFNTAVVEFLTGDNAGLTVETETVSAGAIVLRFQSAYDIAVGDTYRIRPDCRKRFADDCIADYANGINFRGEPWIPLTEESPSQFPGASQPGVGAPNVPGIFNFYVPPVDPPTPPPDLTGAIAWKSFFGVPFGTTHINTKKVIPPEGVAIHFDIPDTTDSVRVLFVTIGMTGISTTRTGALNTTVLDFVTPPTYTWGLGGGLNGGINLPGQDIDFIPKNTYIFNIKNDSPTTSGNWINIQVTYAVQ